MTSKKNSPINLVRSVLDCLPTGLFITDVDGNCIYTNQKFQEVTGLAFSETLGAGWADNVFDEDRKRVLDDWERSKLQNTSFESTHRYRTANGETRWIKTNARRIVDEGVLGGYVGDIEDVTDRIHQEDRWRVIFDHSPTMIYLENSQQQCVFTNSAFLEFTGAPPKSLYGDKWMDFIYEQDAIKLHHAYRIGWLKHQPITAVFRLRSRDGEYRWVLNNAMPWHDNAGNLAGYIGNLVDIHDLKKAKDQLEFQSQELFSSKEEIKEQAALLRIVAEELAAARDVAESASRTKSDFLSNISHEIRTPLNGIMGMAELLRDSGLNSLQQEYVATLKGAGEHLLSVINDVLDFAKIQAGRMSVELSPFDLYKTVKEVMELLDILAKKKDLVVRIDFDPACSGLFLGDPIRLRQVLLNLMGNAIKFTDNGLITVKVILNPQQAVSFSISDTGMGISDTHLRNLFARFSQPDNSTTRRFGGTGLGLVISQQLVELMGGTLDVQSTEGKGTVFTFSLSLARAEKSNPSIKILPTSLSHSGKAVLLVDDNEETRDLVSLYLANVTQDIVVAGNGVEAVEKFKQNHFDLVLMDLQMPEMDGYTATKLIREWEGSQERTHTPIVALTAHTVRGDDELSRAAGCDLHLLKPLRKSTLMEIATKYLGSSKDRGK
jgi:PAS domain S-box-containing protein